MTTRTPLAGLATAAALLAAPLAAALGAQIHVYNLTNGSLADALGGPSLAQFGTNTAGTYGVGGPEGFTFASGGGFTLSNTATRNVFTNPGVYSIELRFLFDATSGYRKILDMKNQTSDHGFYNYGTAATFYGGTGGAGGAIPAGSFVTAVLTRTAAGTVTGYVNGTQQFTFNDVGSIATFSGTNNIVHFLHDDAVQSSEQSSGFVDYIRIYDEALTGAQVAALKAPAVSAVPEPATVALMATGLVALGGVARRRRQG